MSTWSKDQFYKERQHADTLYIGNSDNFISAYLSLLNKQLLSSFSSLPSPRVIINIKTYIPETLIILSFLFRIFGRNTRTYYEREGMFIKYDLSNFGIDYMERVTHGTVISG